MSNKLRAMQIKHEQLRLQIEQAERARAWHQRQRQVMQLGLAAVDAGFDRWSAAEVHSVMLAIGPLVRLALWCRHRLGGRPPWRGLIVTATTSSTAELRQAGFRYGRLPRQRLDARPAARLVRWLGGVVKRLP